LVALAGCEASGPATTSTKSTSFTGLAAKQAFLEEYVLFRRQYTSLDYSIDYHNNSGSVPGPSEWDIRLIAQVPKETIDDWIPAGIDPMDQIDLAWLQEVPSSEAAHTITEWYVAPQTIVGIDRGSGVVAYRIWAN
jgi:hypothetical protein